MANLFLKVDEQLKHENKSWNDIKYALVRIGDDWVSHTDADVFINCASYTNYTPTDQIKARIYGNGWLADIR